MKDHLYAVKRYYLTKPQGVIKSTLTEITGNGRKNSDVINYRSKLQMETTTIEASNNSKCHRRSYAQIFN
jgi:hypothetical protein